MDFLANKKLADGIRELCREPGSKRLAVAFWGPNAMGVLGGQLDQFKIVLDIKMGSTSRQALENLGCPGNENVFVCDGLHSKIYLSETTAIVCSANVSDRALGSGIGERRFEAGVRLSKKADAAAFAEVEMEWQRIEGNAKPVGQDDLDRAPEVPGDNMAMPVKFVDGSLLNLIAANPQHHGNVAVLCSDWVMSEPDINKRIIQFKAQQKKLAMRKNSPTLVDVYHLEFVLETDDQDEICALKGVQYVVVYWFEKGDQGLKVYTDIETLRTKTSDGKKAHVLFGREDFKLFRKYTGLQGFTRKQAFAVDRSLALKLAGPPSEEQGFMWGLYSAKDLADKLAGINLPHGTGD